MTIEQCLETAARLLGEAEMQAIDNPPRSEVLARLAGEWRGLADSLIESQNHES